MHFAFSATHCVNYGKKRVREVQILDEVSQVVNKGEHSLGRLV